jgi:PadR family transcriptional regulator PadR
MTTHRALSFTAVRVLQAIANGTPYGFDIMETTTLPSGTVYPILARLEEQDLVRSRWESVATARRDKRPPRRYYEISAAGRRALVRSIEHYRTLGGQDQAAWHPRNARG